MEKFCCNSKIFYCHRLFFRIITNKYFKMIKMGGIWIATMSQFQSSCVLALESISYWNLAYEILSIAKTQTKELPPNSFKNVLHPACPMIERIAPLYCSQVLRFALNHYGSEAENTVLRTAVTNYGFYFFIL